MDKVMCWLGFHKFHIVEQLSEVSQHIKCGRCGCEKAINYDVRAVLPWAEVKGFYEKRDKDDN